MYAQWTDIKVFQGPATGLIQAEESSEVLAEFQVSESPWPTASRHPESLPSPFSSQHCRRWFAPVQWPRLLFVNWFPGAHRHCRSLRLITLFDYCNTIIHFLLCMLYLSVFTLYSAATVSIEHRQLYPKEGCEGKGSGEIYVALGNLGEKCEISAKWCLINDIILLCKLLSYVISQVCAFLLPVLSPFLYMKCKECTAT